MIEVDADIAIIGSGFAGSLMALVLSRQGLRPVVMDRAAHPRFAIGESSTPIADMILRDLADRYDLPRLRPLSRYGPWKETYPEIGVGRKRGFSYFHHRKGLPFSPQEDHANELLVAASSEDRLSDTHWLRADVDAFLAAEVRGADIPLLEHIDITAIARADSWRIEAMQREEVVSIRTDFLIDASGAGGAVAQTLGVTDRADLFETRSRSIFSHFEGVQRWQDVYERTGGATGDHPFDCDAAALHHVLDGAWMWVLRFDHGVTSAGFMLDANRYPLDPGRTAEEEWASWMARYPSVAEQFAKARITTPPGSIIRTGVLQRRAERVVGEAWAMLPHTAGFIDPLHSTGIAHSLSGVERLGHIFARHWKQPALVDALEAYQQAIRKELDFIDTLVAACYASMKDFRLFAASTMLYFAAVIHYERRRIASADGDDMLFLSAGEDALQELAATALERLRQGIDPAEYEALIERGISPHNTAGLFAPAVPNMYHHTAARV